MAKGTIQRIVRDRGFGFIRPDGGGDEVFFHRSTLQGTEFERLDEGVAVTFEKERGPKGPRAIVVRVEESASQVQSVRSNAERQRERRADTPRARVDNRTTGGEYRFINPYNFIRLIDRERPKEHLLGDAMPMPHDRYVGLSGKIECTVTNQTPLFISDSHASMTSPGDEGKLHPSYRFFEYEGKPALPASSLRGMVRSVFEAVTNSCLSVFDGDQHLEFRERPEYGNLVKVNAGCVTALARKDVNGEIVLCQTAKVGAYYEDADKWKNVLDKRPDGKLWQCGDYAFARAKMVKQGYVVRELALSHGELRPCADGEEYIEGWLKITGKGEGTSKKSEVLFLNPSKHKPVGVVSFTTDEQEEYNRVLTGQLDQEGLPVPPQSKALKPGDLVWVEAEGRGFNKRAKHIVRVQVPRMPYRNTIEALAPLSKKCSDYAKLCPACRTFGWVHPSPPKDNPNVVAAYAGRIRFSHGLLLSDKGTYPAITLAILSSPNPTTPQFYVVNANGQPDPLADYDSPGACLRGRKFYRDHGTAKSSVYSSDIHSDQNRTVRGALKPGACFSFEVSFENLSVLELGALLYVLELEDGLQHRLGYAKPLGFGSVKIKVETVKLLNWQQRYATPDAGAGWQEPLAPEEIQKHKGGFLDTMRGLYGTEFDDVLEDIVKLATAPSTSYTVHYPRPTSKLDMENNPPYEWFVGNKSRVAERKKGKKKLPGPLALPVAQQDDEGLPLIKKDGWPGR